MILQNFKKLFSDIRFWIGFLFGLRLIGITNPPLETGHNWRQAFTNMITRNYVKNGFNFLYPQIDMAGEKSGIVGSEFPVFNYLSFLLSSLTDFEHWHGRLVNLIITSIGLYFFYKLIKALFEEKVAFASTLLLGVSIWFGYGRKIMPDSFSVSLVIMGLWFCYLFLKEGKWKNLILYFTLLSLGLLSKIPGLYLLGCLVILPFLNTISVKRKASVIIITTISVSLVYLWYFYWVPILLKEHQFQLFFEKSFSEGWTEIKPLIAMALKRFYYYAFYGYLAFIASLVGIYFLIKQKNRYYMTAFIAKVFLFIAFIIKTGAVFPHHNYYIIPFVPVMAALGGIALAKIPKKVYPFILILIGIESIANQQHGFFIADKNKYKLELESICDEYISKDELIVINGGQSHQPIYFSNRKGWTTFNDKVKNDIYLDSLIQLGAKKLIIDKHMIDSFSSTDSLLFENKDYKIYSLK